MIYGKDRAKKFFESDENNFLKGTSLIRFLKKEIKEPYNVTVTIKTEKPETDSWKNYKSEFQVEYEYSTYEPINDTDVTSNLTVFGNLVDVIGFLEKTLHISKDDGYEFGKALTKRRYNINNLYINKNWDTSELGEILIKALPKIFVGMCKNI